MQKSDKAGKEVLRRTALKAVRGVRRGLERYESRKPATVVFSKEDLKRVEAFTDAAFKVVDAREAVRKFNEFDKA